ncbi:MAG: hypothetical protein ABJA35_01145 [Parafilimonas sp.]
MEADKKTGIIKNSIQLVVLLFAAFGGFLLNIAPPANGTVNLAVGITEFITLALLLFISAFTNFSLVLNKKRFKRNYRSWLIFSAVCFTMLIATSLLYFNNYGKLVLHVNKWDTTFIRGELSPDAIQLCSEDKYSASQCENQLLKYEYGVKDVEDGLLWTKESMHNNQLRLLLFYLGFIITLSACLFSLIELLSANYLGSQSKPAPRSPPAAV